MNRFLNVLVLVVAILAGCYQLVLKPLLERAGLWRNIESIGNKKCYSVDELQACEKIVLHQPTGVLYLACSSPSSRTAWMPALARFNSDNVSFNDYVATYDPATSRITRLKLVNFKSSRGLSVHGMDVVPSSGSKLFVYLINHRAPIGRSAKQVGADSSIEVFETTVGSDSLTHLRTVEHPAIICPNDIVGFPDGKRFYFTNDHGEKVGLIREADLFGRLSASVGYCHLEHGCKYAITKMHGSNGIARAHNDTFYVVDTSGGVLSILERQSDDSLVISDTVQTDRSLDNVSIDAKGAVWLASFPNVFTLFKHFENPSLPSPSSALRVTLNTGSTSFYGEKFKVEKPFEDDGNVASGTTSVTYDSDRSRLFLHGLMAPYLTVCNV